MATTKDYTCLWNEIISLLGVRVTKETKEAHVEYLRSLTGYMQQWYPHTAIDEIRLAYHIGVLGHLDIDMIVSLTPVQIGKVMKAYRIFRDKELAQNPVAVVTDTSRLLGGGPTKPTAEQNEDAFRSIFHLAYQTIQAGQQFNDLNNVLYDELAARGLSPFTPERRGEFKMQAQEQLRKEAITKSYVGGWDERRKSMALSTLFKQAIDDGTLLTKEIDSIVGLAKKLALTTLLKDLIEQEVTIDEFLKTPTINQTDDAA